jgi:hypothetical protein
VFPSITNSPEEYIPGVRHFHPCNPVFHHTPTLPKCNYCQHSATRFLNSLQAVFPIITNVIFSCIFYVHQSSVVTEMMKCLSN